VPPTPIRVIVDHQGKDAGSAISAEMITKLRRPADAHDLMERPELRDELLPRLLERASGMARSGAATIVARAREEMTAQLDREIHRLRELRKINPSVRQSEIDLVAAQRRDLDTHLAAARLRLDAIRLIQRGG
jgi:ATP-dependent helicase HepA